MSNRAHNRPTPPPAEAPVELAAMNVTADVMADPRGSRYVVAQVDVGPLSTRITLAPDGARGLAKILTELADKAESKIEVAAADAVPMIRGRG